MLELFVGKEEVDFKSERFPAGESFIRINGNNYYVNPSCKITLKFESNDDLINLLMLTDAVRRKYGKAESCLKILRQMMVLRSLLKVY